MRQRIPIYNPPSERLRLLVRGLDTRPTAPRSGSMRVYDGGRVAFEEILSRCAQATESIEVRAFLWRDDEAGNRLGRALLDAAERGVRVTIEKDRIAAVYEYTGGNKQSFFHKRVAPTQGIQAWVLGAVYRAPGSFKQKPNPLSEAILGHANITVNHQRKRFDHSKLFIFDERIITLGSMGIGDNHYAEWIDVMVELEGHEHVARLRQRLGGEVEFDPGRDIDFLVHNRKASPRRHCAMLSQRLALIEAAERSLTIEMAYLGDRRFTNALLRVIKRGVDVTLVTAAQADVLGNLNRATCDTLLRRTGAPRHLTIALLPRMVHSKIVIVDERVCDLGSANFTPLSHGVYDEINLYGVDPGFAQDLREVIVGHAQEGEIASHRLGYRRFRSQLERAVVAYQSRKGGRLGRPPSAKTGERASRRALEARAQGKKPLLLLLPRRRKGAHSRGDRP